MEFRPGEYISKVIMSPLAFMIPWQYKPIQALQVAEFIRYLIKTDFKGNHIWEGKLLFQDTV